MSVLSRVMNRLLGRKTSTSRISKRNALKRQLRFESVEERRLLAFGAISGNIFTDITDNGLTADDTPIAAATVTLFRDVNTDGAIDAGDTNLGTQQSDASGDYLFEDLTNGQYIIQQTAVNNLLQRVAQTTQIVTVANDTGVSGTPIDRFETVTNPDPLQAAAGVTASDQQTAPVGVPSEIIGGERDVFISNDVGSGSNLTFNVDPAGTVLIDAGVTTTGQVLITYDGVDADAQAIGHNLGGIDLTASNGRAFRFNVGSQVGSLLTVEVYSGDNQTASSRTLVIPSTVGGAPSAELDFEFSDFARLAGATADADFTNVSAIRIRANLAAADDISVDLIGIVELAETTANFANLAPMSIGDQIFQDANNNGVFDAGEAGIAGVVIDLYEDDGSGSLDQADTLIDTVTSDANGNYLFGGSTSLLPGSYIVSVRESNFNAGSTLEGFVTSTGNDPAPSPDNNVNNDDNGTVVAGFGVASQIITLAAATEPTDDGDANNNSNLSLDFGFVPQIDLAVTKVVQGGAASVVAGEQLTYTVTVTNNGQVSATNVVLTDDLPNLSPTGLNIVSVNSQLNGTVATNGPANGEITVSYATLAAGATDTVTIVVGVPADAAAATGVVNTASVVADESETDQNNNTASANIDITRNAVLTVTKSDSADPVSVGGNFDYTIVVTNTGSSTANNVVITDTLPAGLSVNGTITSTLGTVTPNGNAFTVNVPSLAVNQATTITVPVIVDQAFAGTSVTNTVSATADEAQNIQATQDTTINPSIDLAITKVDGTDPINRGATQTYTLVVTNNGPSSATNVSVTDTLPANVTFVNASGGTVTAPTGGSNDVVVNLGTIASGNSSTITVTATVDNDAPDTITNTATVTSDENAFEVSTTNNTTSAETTVNPAIDLVVTKTDNSDPVNAGENLTYTITVANNGPSTANNVQFTDALPAGVTFVSVNSSQGSVSNSNGTISGNLGTIASGANATVTLVVAVDSTLAQGATITNTASATGDENETNNTDNSATQTTAVNRSVDLQVTKVDNAATVSPGSSLNYEIIVSNNGPSTATSVVLTDPLPSDLSFVNGTSTQGTVTENNGTVTVDIGTLGPTDSVTVTLNTIVVGTTPGTISNTATVTGAEAEAVTTNNSATDTADLQAAALSKRLLLASA